MKRRKINKAKVKLKQISPKIKNKKQLLRLNILLYQLEAKDNILNKVKIIIVCTVLKLNQRKSWSKIQAITVVVIRIRVLNKRE